MCIVLAFFLIFQIGDFEEIQTYHSNHIILEKDCFSPKVETVSVIPIKGMPKWFWFNYYLNIDPSMPEHGYG